MITIHRVEFKVDDIVELCIPGFKRALKIKKVSDFRADHFVEMWYETDPGVHGHKKNVIIFAEGTGHDVTTRDVQYVDTCIWKYDYTRLVFHFYVGIQ